MQIYSLVGLSKRGKQVVKQYGDRWELLDSKDTVNFTDFKVMP